MIHSASKGRGSCKHGNELQGLFVGIWRHHINCIIYLAVDEMKYHVQWLATGAEKPDIVYIQNVKNTKQANREPITWFDKIGREVMPSALKTSCIRSP